jgi:hypothetical protein
MKQVYIDNMSDWERKLMDKHPAMFKHLWRPPECSEGWSTLLDDLMTDMERVMEESGEDITLRVFQIKEKFGGLRFYADVDGSVEIAGALAALVSEAERRSYSICEVCGAEGELRRERSWIRTLCDTHDREAANRQ